MKEKFLEKACSHKANASNKNFRYNYYIFLAKMNLNAHICGICSENNTSFVLPELGRIVHGSGIEPTYGIDFIVLLQFSFRFCNLLCENYYGLKLLIIEDEKELSKSMVTYLQTEGYVCDTAQTFAQALEKLEGFDYDCVLLDITLPDGSGLKILESLKIDRKMEGVIIISAKDSIDDRVAGLNLGADDYLAKPFHLSELSARIAAVIRRKKFEGSNLLRFNELAIDLLAKTVSVNSTTIDITRKEYDLLLYLVSNKNRVISKNAIAENISGDNVDVYDNFDFIYAHMKNLKRKLTAAGCADYIKSIYGMGYKFTI